MGERQIVLGRVGHYFDAGNGSCSTGLIVQTFEPPAGFEGAARPEPTVVNVAGWNHDGAEFRRTSVPVDAAPTTEAHANSFHLTRDCPWGR